MYNKTIVAETFATCMYFLHVHWWNHGFKRLTSVCKLCAHCGSVTCATNWGTWASVTPPDQSVCAWTQSHMMDHVRDKDAVWQSQMCVSSADHNTVAEGYLSVRSSSVCAVVFCHQETADCLTLSYLWHLAVCAIMHLSSSRKFFSV